MINELILSHFKAFDDPVSVDLAPITLIYGANSSGKSSLLQSLLLWQQTLSPSNQPNATLTFRGEGGVDLGNFENLVFGHDVSEKMCIGIGVKATLPIGGGKRGSAPARLVVRFEREANADVAVAEIDLHLFGDPEPTIALRPEENSEGPTNEPAGLLQRRYYVSSIWRESKLFKDAFVQYSTSALPQHKEELKRFLEVSRGPGKRSLPPVLAMTAKDVKELEKHVASLENYTFDNFIDDAIEQAKRASYTLAHFLPGPYRDVRDQLWQSDSSLKTKLRYVTNFLPVMDLAPVVLAVTQAVRKEVANIGYIGPFREQPERNYIYSGAKADSVGSRGQNLPHLLFSNNDYQGALNELAAALGLNYEIKLTRGKGQALDEVFALRLIDKRTRTNVGINDVGFGISQILPILLESMLPGRGTVLIEQPEIHIHPKLQADLASILVRAVRKPLSKQFIVETHSEHILLRLQKLIRDKKLDSTALKVFFVSRDRQGSHIQELRVAANGDLLDHWPGDFFDDAYREMFS